MKVETPVMMDEGDSQRLSAERVPLGNPMRNPANTRANTLRARSTSEYPFSTSELWSNTLRAQHVGVPF